MSLLKSDNISFYRSDRKILHRVNFSVNSDEKWVILGANGSGKSTLLKIFAGYEWPSEGSSLFENISYQKYPVTRIREIVHLFQPALQEALIQKNLTTFDIIATGVLRTLGMYGVISKSAQNRIHEILKQEKMDHLLDQSFSLLSSGEKRKVILMRSMVAHPELLLLDEPFENLDLPAREKTMDMVESMDKRISTLKGMILVTHRLEDIPVSFSHVLLLKNGQVFNAGLKNELIQSDTISNLYDWPVDVYERNGRYFST